MVEGDVADLLLRIVLDGEQFELPSLPPVVGGTWGDLSLEGLWGPVSFAGPELVWEVQVVHGAPGETDAKLRRFGTLRNAPALLHLADGTGVQAKFGHLRRWGGRVGMSPGYTCDFGVWRVEGPTPARWVGRLQGCGFLNANLTIAGPGPRFTRNSMRLQGRYTWYLLNGFEETASAVVVIDAGPSPLDHEAIGTDFNAMQVAFGTPMQLDTLVALDGPGNVVGCAGVHLGGNRKTERRRRADGPVPDNVTNECWIPVLFNRLALAMAASDLPWGMICNAYLDSASDATIDGRYLKLQVALEAFAKALLKRAEATNAAPRRLVRDADAWGAWVKKRRDELRAMVEDQASADVFINKVISAMNLPSSGVVADALRRLQPPLIVDEVVLDELEKRNIPAHHLRMNKPGVDYDIDRDVERVDILRSLYVALVARACGYDGAIAGWVRSKAAEWKPQPDWWPPPPESVIEESRRDFLCERSSPPSSRPQAFRSRLRKKRKSK